MAQSINVTQPSRVKHDHNILCRQCSLYRLCLPLRLHTNELVQIDRIIKRGQSYSRGQSLFAPEKPFESLFLVRSGSFKTSVHANGGREQVTGFYFPGEFIGMDAIYKQNYQSTAKALESGSSVCELPFEKLLEFTSAIPLFQMQMMLRLSKELSDDKSLILLLGKKTAEEKLATFLLSLSRRFQDRGFSAYRFQLTMLRGDIANHLGLAVETVSRLFTCFQNEGLVSIRGKAISLLDVDKLEKLCG